LALDGCKWSALSPSQFTPKERTPQYPLDRRLGGTQSWSDYGSKEKKFPAPAGNQTPIIQPIA